MPGEEFSSQMGRELRAAADEVIAEIKDGVSRSCYLKRVIRMEWQVDFEYTFPWGGWQLLPPLIIEEPYPFVPARELSKNKMRRHLLANPPKTKE